MKERNTTPPFDTHAKCMYNQNKTGIHYTTPQSDRKEKGNQVVAT